MKVRFIFLLFCILAFPPIMKAQNEFRPIIDSAVTCSYHNYMYEFSENPSTSKQVLQIYYIVDNMPMPETHVSKIANILQDGVLFSRSEKTFDGDIYFQCIINCKGQAGDFQIIHCPEELDNIGWQVINIFREQIQNWKPGTLRNKKVDVLIKLWVKIRNGSFEVIAPQY